MSAVKLRDASGCFFRVDDFEAAYARMTAAGSKFVTAPRTGNYGRIAVFSTSRATAGT